MGGSVLCYYHPDAQAVGTCVNCGRGLCVSCAGEAATKLACKGSCENQLLELDQLRVKSKSSFRTAASVNRTAGFAFTVLAFILGFIGAFLVFAKEGVIGYIAVGVAAVFFLGALFRFSIARKYDYPDAESSGA